MRTNYPNWGNSLKQVIHTYTLKSMDRTQEFQANITYINAISRTWGHSRVTPCRYKTSPFVPIVQTPTKPTCLSISIDMSSSLTWGGTRIHGPVVISFDRLMKEKKWYVGNMKCFRCSCSAKLSFISNI